MGGAAAASAGVGRQQEQREADEEDEELEDRLSPEDFQSLLQQRGLDCCGWKLVVAAHSLGAAVAALVGMHFRSFAPGGSGGDSGHDGSWCGAGWACTCACSSSC